MYAAGDFILLFGETMENLVKKTKGMTRTHSRLIFYTIMLIWPMLQFFLFYWYVNFNTILLAFQRIGVDENTGFQIITFDKGFTNFNVAWNRLIVDYLPYIGNALKFYAIDFPVALTLALSFSFYIYKKYPGAGLFKTMLFMPTLVSGLVFSIIFKYLATYGYQEVVCLIKGIPVNGASRTEAAMGLFDNPDTAFFTLVFYNIFISFGSNILLYSGAMSGIDESVVESAHLDGTNLLQEFWHISLPLIFPTIISLVVVSLTGVFTNQLGVVSMFGSTFPAGVADKVQTIGYKMYIHSTQLSDMSKNTDMFEHFDTSMLSAYGLLVSIVIVPAVLTIRKLMKKFGPSVD